MPKVKFVFDKEKDLWNIWGTCNEDSPWYNHKKNVSSTLTYKSFNFINNFFYR